MVKGEMGLAPSISFTSITEVLARMFTKWFAMSDFSTISGRKSPWYGGAFQSLTKVYKDEFAALFHRQLIEFLFGDALISSTVGQNRSVSP